MSCTYNEFASYTGYILDDTGNGRQGHSSEVLGLCDQYKYRPVLVGFQCGFEPMVVAVHSYLDVPLSSDEAVEMADDYLREIGWLDRDDVEVYVMT